MLLATAGCGAPGGGGSGGGTGTGPNEETTDNGDHSTDGTGGGETSSDNDNAGGGDGGGSEVAMGGGEAPVIHLAPVAAVTPGQDAILDASATTDPEGDELTFEWRQADPPAGVPRVNLRDEDTPVARFRAPSVEEDLEIEFVLTVSDGVSSVSQSLFVEIDAAEADTPVTLSIMASADPASGPAPLLVEFSAGASDGGGLPDGLYAWDFGDTATGSGTDVSHVYNRAGDYNVTVRLFDADAPSVQLASDSLTVTVMNSDGSPGTPGTEGGDVGAGTDGFSTDGFVGTDGLAGTGGLPGSGGGGGGGGGGSGANEPPVAVAGANPPEPAEGAFVALDGTASYDPDSGPAALTYGWTQTGGTDVTGSPGFNPAAAAPTFTAPAYTGNAAQDTLTFELVVFDGEDSSTPADVTMTVHSCASGTDSDGDGTADCADGCPADPDKTTPGACGCGFSDEDADGDGAPDCDAPAAYDETYYVIANRHKFIDLRTLAHETVPGQLPALRDMSKLTFTIVTPPAHGTLAPSWPKTTLGASLPSAIYVPNSGYTGDDSFTFTVRDTSGRTSNRGTILLHVGGWQPPAGIPDPGFGVTQSHLDYSASAFNFRPAQVLTVAASANDAYWDPDAPAGGWQPTATSLHLIGDGSDEKQAFLRFPLNIPSGSVIKKANLRFVIKNGTVSLPNQPASIWLLNAVNMPSLATDQSGTGTLGTPAPWLIDLSWAPKIGDEIYTWDFTSLVQQYIDQPGRVPGNYIGLKITRDTGAAPPSSWALVTVRPWDSASGVDAPVLTVWYEPPGHNPAQSYPDAGNGPYTHYVDFNSGVSRDVTADGLFNYGSPILPRKTIPTFLPPGSVVQLHGTTASSTDRLYITGLVESGNIGGTAAKPIFIRGTSWSDPAVFRQPIQIRCNYIILENLASTVALPGTGRGNFEVWNTQQIDHNFSPTTGPVAFHHVAIRHSTCQPEGGVVTSGFVDLHIWRDDAVTTHHDIVIYDNHMFGLGDWTKATGATDQGAIGMFPNVTDVWVLENDIHNIEGDALSTPSEGLALGSPRRPATRLFVGRNHMHHCRENHIDGKLTQGCIVSQNKMYTVMALGPEGSSNPDSIVFHHGGGQSDFTRAADDLWVIFNEFYDVGGAMRHTSNGPVPPADPTMEARSYLIGNLVHDTWDGPRGLKSPFSAGTSVACRIVNNTIYHCVDGLHVGDSGSVGITGYVRNNIIADLTEDQRQVLFAAGATVGALNHDLYDLDPVLNPQLKVRVAPVTYKTLASLQAAGYGQGSLVTAVHFMAAGTGDFRLAPGSPGINAGAADEVYDLFNARWGLNIRVDLLGNPRPAGGAWDMGAFESVP